MAQSTLMNRLKAGIAIERTLSADPELVADDVLGKAVTFAECPFLPIISKMLMCEK